MINQNFLNDDKERLQALDATKSFIIQAPAGSGKTELLTQRFLTLLALVNEPEEILSITFTKKSAAEMRFRILSALKTAANAMPIPDSLHVQKTYALAKSALARDKKLSWQLLSNPNRLRIQTIDSFNAYLTKQLPIISRFGAGIEITTEVNLLYNEAIYNLCKHLEENAQWLVVLLTHLDNDLNKLAALLVNLLAKRDQWLELIVINAKDSLLRKKLEKNLVTINLEILNNIQRSFPNYLINDLLFVIHYAISHINWMNASKEMQSLKNIAAFPYYKIENKVQWLGIIELLLTKNDEWRKRIDKNYGFYPESYFVNKEEKKQAKIAKMKFQTLLKELAKQETLKQAFIDLRNAPQCFYTDENWQVLEALHQALQLAYAYLKLIFQQAGKIDYIENAAAALHALGTDDAPTDLTLALDYQIKHILIDEFQDTSIKQYQLITKLISPWDREDGRTLFLVGDPMQSIYRFREAEVGLFIKTRQSGIGNVNLVPLTLNVNFRSTPKLVTWFNKIFTPIFPCKEDVGMGAIPYTESIGLMENKSSSTIGVFSFAKENPLLQAEKVIELIKTTEKENSIALLVRSRSHLATIIPLLKKNQINFRAVDIDPLNEKMFIQDLLSLTRALLYPADRIAWLALLRAPFCGLKLQDLLMIGKEENALILDQLKKKDIILQLSNEAQIKLKRMLPILQIKIKNRKRLPLRQWIESTWLLLGGPACLEREEDLEDAASFFTLLETMELQQDEIDFTVLNETINKLYATPNHEAENQLQIMTIHNAKGLEFDTVILPYLDKQTTKDEAQLLLWMQQYHHEQQQFFLAPIQGSGNGQDTIYNYIKRQNILKNNYENARLLYVAATRAKKNLYLLYNLPPEKLNNELAKPFPGSLLEQLWQAKLPAEMIINTKGETDNTIPVSKQKMLRYLALDWKNPVQESKEISTVYFHQQKNGFMLLDQSAKYVGTLIHFILQQIALQGILWWQSFPLEERYNYIIHRLRQLKTDTIFLQKNSEKIMCAIENTISDSRGQWILQPHKKAHNEFALTAVIEGKPQQLIIDRTFLDEDNIRWIIDYKTSYNKTGNSLANFLLAEKIKYQQQMQTYHTAFKIFQQHTICLGLYFPLLKAWYEWKIEE